MGGYLSDEIAVFGEKRMEFKIAHRMTVPVHGRYRCLFPPMQSEAATEGFIKNKHPIGNLQVSYYRVAQKDLSSGELTVAEIDIWG